ncbi:MAG TPA: hypothetical protein VFJ74_15720 [Gemmatimonadaceae bacterium]|nr:hypothetical protein [Gemmatimonadaceae bacterium]
MPTLAFRLKQRPDAHAQLVLVRDDGSSTVGAVGPADGYGPVHDLAHYVAERALELSSGFLGLVASGWTIDDFEVRGTAQRLPDEAVLAEMVAGELSREEMTRQRSSAEEFKWGVAAWLAGARPGYAPAPIAADALDRMRAELAELRGRWRAVAPGETLELRFESAHRSTCPRPERAANDRGHSGRG